jgi:hypothetical protein
MIFGKALMRFDRVGGNADNFSSRRRIIIPAVAHRAHLPSADRSFVAGIKKQHDDFPAVIGQTPVGSVAVGQSEIRSRASFLGT